MEKLKRMLQPYPRSGGASAALLLLRLVVGTAFIIHGWPKIQNPFGWMGPQSPVPGFFQLLAAVSEFGGGIAWVLGLLTPLAALGIGCTMTVAVYMHSMVLHDPFVNLTGGRSFELASAYLCIAVLLLAMGPGRFSLDASVYGDRQ
jgi:putative oxidoreductase